MQYQSLLSPSYFYYFRWKTQAEYFWYTSDDIGKLEQLLISQLQNENLFKFPGIDHGSDVFLIFNGRFNSEEERVVIKHFVDMYYNFAASNTAIYGNLTIERIEPNDFKALEINSPTEYGITQLNDEFGQVQFWHGIDETFASTGASRNNFVIVSIVCLLAALLFTN